MYTKAFENEQTAIKAVQEGRYEYVRTDGNFIIETKIKTPYTWVSSKSGDF